MHTGVGNKMPVCFLILEVPKSWNRVGHGLMFIKTMYCLSNVKNFIYLKLKLLKIGSYCYNVNKYAVKISQLYALLKSQKKN